MPASHHPQLQQRAGVGHGLDVGMRLRTRHTQDRDKHKDGATSAESVSARCRQQHIPQLSCAAHTTLGPGPAATSSPGRGVGGSGTHHCRELVELRPQVGAPEVDVGGFVPHLVTAGQSGQSGAGQKGVGSGEEVQRGSLDGRKVER